ncbi:MAG: Uma2 family endonuclease, partial [Microcystis sp. 53598_E5]|nr:Uma2 family endonuclease [Microcystis sp. 53598_E5]
DEQFYHLCQANQTWNLERNQKGELLIMPPVGGNTGKQEANLIVKVGVWNEQTQLGEVFSSSTIFRLPNGGYRSPDVAWIKRERWEALSAEEREKFPPLCPDFVIELRSRTDALTSLREKMREYLASGLRFRLNSDGEIINLPAILSGEDVLPGFVLNLT